MTLSAGMVLVSNGAKLRAVAIVSLVARGEGVGVVRSLEPLKGGGLIG